MCLHAIEATKSGIKATDLALANGMYRRMVLRWLGDYYKSGGEPALMAKPIPDLTLKLDEPKMQPLTPLARRSSTASRLGCERCRSCVS